MHNSIGIISQCEKFCLEFPSQSQHIHFPYEKEHFLRADLHGTTLTHVTSLRQAYDMTWDHLHAYDVFTYKIKYAKVCTGIYGAKTF